jgi:glutathione S-transferase
MSRAGIPRLIANAADVCTKKILVAAQAASVELSLEAPKKGSRAVPELHRGDQVIRYTNAILRHVGRCFEDSDIYGSSFFESSQVDAWLDWAEGELADENPPRLQQAIEALERHLGDRVFLVGQRFTIADASVSCSLHDFQQRGVAGSKDLPRATKRWLGTCTAHQAFSCVIGGAPPRSPKQNASRSPKNGPAPAPVASAATAPAGPDAQGPLTVRPPVTATGPLVAKYSSCVGGRTMVARILRTEDGGVGLIGQKVSVCGWVKTKRDGNKGALAFVELNDGSCFGSLQVVIEDSAKGFSCLKENCGTGASLKCVGEVVKSPGNNQAVELLVKGSPGHEVHMFGGVDAKVYPLAKKTRP